MTADRIKSEQMVKEFLMQKLELDNLENDTPLEELEGIGSMMIVEMIFFCKTILSKRFPRNIMA